MASPIGSGSADTPAPRRRALVLPNIPRWLVYTLGLLPAAWTFYLAVVDELGADPMRTLEHTLGIWALRFLIAGLAITPLRQFTGINLVRYRRAVGLLAFYYVAMHFAVYVGLDRGLDAGAIIADIVKRPYITGGFAAFVLLVPLAVTSNTAAIRRLGGKAWSKLHRLVYPAAILAAAHFLLLVKSWPAEPLIYAGLVAILLLYRVVRHRARSNKPTT